MRKVSALLVLSHVTVVPPTLAGDVWRAKAVLEPGAPAVCKEADVSNVFLDLSRTGDQLSIRTNSGETFSAPINPDDHVKTTISVPVGKRSFAVELSGNVATQQIVAINSEYSCRFRLVPLS